VKIIAYDRYALSAVTGHKIKDVDLDGDRYEGYTVIIRLSGGLELHIESDTEPTIALYAKEGHS